MGTEGRLLRQGQPRGRPAALPGPGKEEEEEEEGNSKSLPASLGSHYLLASSLSAEPNKTGTSPHPFFDGETKTQRG